MSVTPFFMSFLHFVYIGHEFITSRPQDLLWPFFCVTHGGLSASRTTDKKGTTRSLLLVARNFIPC